jgi:hypothetical protein
VFRGNGNGDKARDEGVLSIEPGCVFLVRGPDRTLLAWPDERTSWDGSTLSIVYIHDNGVESRLFNGQRWAVGGSDSFAAVLDRVDWVSPPRPECAVARIWFVGEVIEVQ